MALLSLRIRSQACRSASVRSSMIGRAAIYNGDEGSESPAMPPVATWSRPKDEKWFRRAFAKHPNVRLWNARTQQVPMEKMQGLLLSGGPDIAEEFLRQPVPDPSILDTDVEPARGRVGFRSAERCARRAPSDLRDLQRHAALQRRARRHSAPRYSRPQRAGN